MGLKSAFIFGTNRQHRRLFLGRSVESAYNFGTPNRCIIKWHPVCFSPAEQRWSAFNSALRRRITPVNPLNCIRKVILIVHYSHTIRDKNKETIVKDHVTEIASKWPKWNFTMYLLRDSDGKVRLISILLLILILILRSCQKRWGSFRDKNLFIALKRSFLLYLFFLWIKKKKKTKSVLH